MTKEKPEITLKAEEFARANKTRIAKEFTDISKHPKSTRPISIFMAGSPGAGKTEYSENIKANLEVSTGEKIIRIDGDELRPLFPDYNGSNSHLFQSAISILVDKIHDTTLENKQTFILDGTLSKYDKAFQNIKRSVDKGRLVIIFYMYQEPETAWKFTLAREVKKGRNIPKEAFIEHFISSKETIRKIRAAFDQQVNIVLIKRDFEHGKIDEIEVLLHKGKQIDEYFERSYTKDDLEKIL